LHEAYLERSRLFNLAQDERIRQEAAAASVKKAAAEAAPAAAADNMSWIEYLTPTEQVRARETRRKPLQGA
jgi:hypothetical protein